ncbi:MAG: PIN domain-containing protein [Deltaproteobacteria bacterium]|nr:PIN domain-containing protein [Deltaproteobacteria bacterium]
MMTSERTFLDANLLVYALYRDMPQYPAARLVLERTQEENAALCVNSQVLAEFYAIITNPRRVTAPFSSGEALREVEKICSAPGTIVLPQPVDAITRWIALLRRHPVTRKRIFDVQLVATMLANGITRIYTFNVRDFRPFPEITAIEPREP